MISEDIKTATENIGTITIKGEVRTLPKTSPLGMIKYTKRLEAMLEEVLKVLDAKDTEIKTIQTDVTTVKEDVTTLKTAAETKP